jgi:hypothetical protein
MTCLLPHRRAVLSIALVAGPVLVAAGNLLSGDPASYSPADLVATLSTTSYLVWSLVADVGVVLLGAIGIAGLVLVSRRGGVLATIGATLALLGTGLLGGVHVLITLFEHALDEQAVPTMMALMGNPLTGLAELTLTLIAFLGVALVAISLLVARTVPVWVGVLLLVALVPIYLANQFGPAGNWLWLPYLAAMVACAIRLPAATAAVDERDPNSPAVSVS